MKVGIIYIGDLRVCPFIQKYIEVLQKNAVDIDVILWHRIKEEDNTKYFDGINVIEYNGILKNNNKIGKVKHLFKFRNFASKIIKNNNYDKIIVLTTLTALLLKKRILNKYKTKYVFDYRDVTYETIPMLKKAIIKIADNSEFTAISSEGFKNVLGDKKYMYLAHNFNYFDIDNSVPYRELCPKEKINIVFIGMIREYEMCKKMIEIFGNDERFNVTIHGGGTCFDEVKELASQYNNVNLTGAFKYTEKPQLLSKADMLAYFYPVNPINQYAIANKFYDGMMYKIPTIGNQDTYSGQKVVELGVGCSIDWNASNEDIKQYVFNYYNSIDSNEFNDNANNYMKEVLSDDKKYLDKIEEFIKA